MKRSLIGIGDSNEKNRS